MRIGVPREIKPDEYRVAMTPAGVHALTHDNHTVLIEKGAGLGSGISDEEYKAAGADLVASPDEVYGTTDMIVKVKEPLSQEYGLLQDGQVLFTYFHFAASRDLTDAMLNAGVIAIAYETIHDEKGRHPLLDPMSEVAGRMAVHEGAKHLEKPMEGRGVLLAGVPGVPPAEVAILGGGVVGANAAKIAAGLGAQVTVLDIDLYRLRYLDDIMPKNVVVLMSDSDTVPAAVEQADLLIGCVLIEGAKAPVLVPESLVSRMKPGSVIVDVAIDQGGCVETSHPTTHSAPTFIVHDVVHYCVANMPGAVGRTSTYALTNATIPYAHQLANEGWEKAVRSSDSLRSGVNIVKGEVTCKAVAETFGLTSGEVLGS